MNKYQDTNRFLEDICASSYVTLLFGVYTLILLLVTTPSTANWVHADPVLKIFPKTMTLWGIPALSLVLCLFWKALNPLQPQAIPSSVKFALSGSVTAVVALLALRLLLGAHLPAFVPPEESVKPGLLLGMSAGLIEELVTRLAVTPLTFVILRKWLGFHGSALITILIAALSFALWHEIGLPTEPFDVRHFATRFIGPGVVMGLVTFYISPIFLVALHGTAHIMMPMLFV